MAVIKDENEREDIDFLALKDMKKKPVFKEIAIEAGHPEHVVNNVSEKLEDLGFKIEGSGSKIDQDDINENIKNFHSNLKAIRTEKEFRKKFKNYRLIFLISLGISILFLVLVLVTQEEALGYLTAMGVINTVVFYLLWKPKIKADSIWVKVEGKVYSGMRTKEVRDSHKDKAGQTRSASMTYVHSELIFKIAGESEIDEKRVREDISVISGYIQKL